jgi:hypothetical protein
MKAKTTTPASTFTSALTLNRKTTLPSLRKGRFLHDLDEAATITGLCARYVRQLCRERKIEHYKIQGRYYISAAQVAAMLKRVPVGRAGKAEKSETAEKAEKSETAETAHMVVVRRLFNPL